MDDWSFLDVLSLLEGGNERFRVYCALTSAFPDLSCNVSTRNEMLDFLYGHDAVVAYRNKLKHTVLHTVNQHQKAVTRPLQQWTNNLGVYDLDDIYKASKQGHWKELKVLSPFEFFTSVMGRILPETNKVERKTFQSATGSNESYNQDWSKGSDHSSVSTKSIDRSTQSLLFFQRPLSSLENPILLSRAGDISLQSTRSIDCSVSSRSIEFCSRSTRTIDQMDLFPYGEELSTKKNYRPILRIGEAYGKLLHRARTKIQNREKELNASFEERRATPRSLPSPPPSPCIAPSEESVACSYPTKQPHARPPTVHQKGNDSESTLKTAPLLDTESSNLSSGSLSNSKVVVDNDESALSFHLSALFENSSASLGFEEIPTSNSPQNGSSESNGAHRKPQATPPSPIKFDRQPKSVKGASPSHLSQKQRRNSDASAASAVTFKQSNLNGSGGTPVTTKSSDTKKSRNAQPTTLTVLGDHEKWTSPCLGLARSHDTFSLISQPVVSEPPPDRVQSRVTMNDRLVRCQFSEGKPVVTPTPTAVHSPSSYQQAKGSTANTKSTHAQSYHESNGFGGRSVATNSL